MRIATAQSRDPDTLRAVAEAYDALVADLGGAPEWLVVESAVRHDGEALRQALMGRGCGRSTARARASA
ncbi:MAG: hypothetical protein H6710_24040 [Myxococcales bacterium]|nr:hypothetical protein [Myxococcales bacterium]